MATVRFARSHGLLVSVRGGGHNAPGIAVCEGGLMIDLAGMRSVRVDPARHTARAEGGTTWSDFDRETQVFGLATTGGAEGVGRRTTSTVVVTLFTLILLDAAITVFFRVVGL